MRAPTRQTFISFLFPLIPLFALGLCPFVYAQQEPVYETEEIVVTASRIPSTFSETTRSVIVIGQDDIAHAPVHSLDDLLEYAVGADVRQRGPLGVQADVSIRGGTFEQTLILIDGIKVSDPQTGHHNMNLPLTLNIIERIEILKGQGSRLYGPNAFGGVINIITKKGRGKEVNLQATVGEYGFTEGDISLSYPLGSFGHRMSLSKKKSDGYRENTDFDISTVSYGSSIQVGPGTVDMSLGYTDKEFGANGFYAAPTEWEQTKTTFLHAGANLKHKEVSLSPKLYWRRHKDDYIYIRESPEVYRNHHTTDVYGIEVASTVRSKLGSTALGGEIGKEVIASNRLGNHERTKGGLFAEHRIGTSQKLIFTPGASAYYYTDWGWKLWPGFDLGLPLTSQMRLYGSVGRSFRVPTYTDLYYIGPNNQGNPNLRPEEAWSYEAGMNWTRKTFRGNISVFRRESRDLIDWIRVEERNQWEANNITSVTTNGVEISIGGHFQHFPVSRFQVSYAFLDSDKETKNFESRYVLDHLRHQLVVDIAHNLPYNVKQNWKVRYEDRLRYPSHVLVDTRISRKIKTAELFVEATNLFNTIYKEVGSIPVPGRWIQGGLNLNSSLP